PKVKSPCCSNCDRSSQGFIQQLRARVVGGFPVATGEPSVTGGITPPHGLRWLTPPQVTTAMGVFGGSLDYGSILLSDALGLGGRPFTLAVQLPPSGSPSWTVVVINAGTFTPPTNLLIDELTHAWQSQHAIDPTALTKNSVESQGIADTLNALGADAS